ncbi:MAG: histidine phosphatase family protein [Thermoanaerobaculia bacterium]
MIETLIFVRHGETVDNLRGVAQGWSDSDLSPRGQEQVKRLARRLTRMEPTSLYSSTLPRAITTATVIAGEIALDPVPLDDLREMHCGRWEGQSFVELRNSDEDAYQRWAGDPEVACPEGESYADVLIRMKRALQTIETRENGNGRRPVIVSHGTAIRIIATELLGIDLRAARNLALDNAAVNVFERRGERWVLKVWNDTTHCEGAVE